MIVTSCPLRISLVGGSTDHPWFLEKYGQGEVISFASNLRTYITLHQDVFGANSLNENYVISYSKRESVSTISEIQNELIRNCFEYLDVKEKLNVSLTSDIYSAGSGLASSSSYLLGLIKSIYELRNEHITDYEICKIAKEIEEKFNPLVGQQDFYGSIGGLKKIKFYKDEDPDIRFLNSSIFEIMDVYLIYTGLIRNSTSILETIDIDKSLPLLQDVKDLEVAINKLDIDSFNEIILRSWENKKKISPQICGNSILKQMDDVLKSDEMILSHKLCGAGNGGYFLIFTEKDLEKTLKTKYNNIKKICFSETGLTTINFTDGFN
jgi:D-glycero-alpha-D-manno-heptose-7-phosphate kinase